MRTPQKAPPPQAAPKPSGRPLTVEDLSEDDHSAALKAMAQGRRGIALALRVAREAAPQPSWRLAYDAPTNATPILAIWADVPGRPIMKVISHGGVWRAIITDPTDLVSSRLVELQVPFTHWCPIPEVPSAI